MRKSILSQFKIKSSREQGDQGTSNDTNDHEEQISDVAKQLQISNRGVQSTRSKKEKHQLVQKDSDRSTT